MDTQARMQPDSNLVCTNSLAVGAHILVMHDLRTECEDLSTVYEDLSTVCEDLCTLDTGSVILIKVEK